MIQFWEFIIAEIGICEIAKMGFSGDGVSFCGGGLGFECAKMDSFAQDGDARGPGVRDCFVYAFIS